MQQMLPFEKDICTLLDDNKVAYTFNAKEHTLNSEKLRIRFIPNLSTKLKMKASGGKGIKLWEDIYLNRRAQVNSRIRSLLGLNKRLHGRETRLSEITKEDYEQFLDTHHLMGITPAKHRLGLFSSDELVAVAGFGRACPIDYEGKTYRSHELIRFCNKTGFTVVGGLSKLIKHFVKEKQVEHLMTYVDREWSEGNIYLKLGFQCITTTPPQEFFLSPLDHQRHRQAALASAGIDFSNWPKLANLGNYKFIRIYTK